jgi:hypothetical protein
MKINYFTSKLICFPQRNSGDNKKNHGIIYDRGFMIKLSLINSLINLIKSLTIVNMKLQLS